MRVNHSGADVLVPEQFLYGPDIVTRFQQVCCKAVAKGVAANPFDNAGTGNGLLDGPLQDCFVQVMSALLAVFAVFPAVLLWEDPLPTPLCRRVRVFPIKGIR